jgi:hypothetical protein
MSAAARDLAHLRRALQRPGALVAHAVYECPSCGERLVGQQRCGECGVFGRALGLGGACPDCDTVILLADVLAQEVPPS